MISKSIAERVLAEALTTGGDFAELFMEDTRQMGIMLMDGMIDSAEMESLGLFQIYPWPRGTRIFIIPHAARLRKCLKNEPRGSCLPRPTALPPGPIGLIDFVIVSPVWMWYHCIMSR